MEYFGDSRTTLVPRHDAKIPLSHERVLVPAGDCICDMCLKEVMFLVLIWLREPESNWMFSGYEPDVEAVSLSREVQILRKRLRLVKPALSIDSSSPGD